MHLLLGARMNHLHRPSAIGARQVRSGAEQAADQRAFVINRAAAGAQVNTVEFIQCGLLLGGALARQARHFFRRRGHRPATVVTARHAVKRRNLLAQKADFFAVATHQDWPLFNGRDSA